MKNVGMKAESYRTAVATGILHAPPHCIELLRNGNTEKVMLSRRLALQEFWQLNVPMSSFHYVIHYPFTGLT